MNFDSVQVELKKYLSQHNIWKLFLPIAELLIIVVHLAMIVGNFVDFGILSTIIVMLGYISLVMVLAKGNYKVLTIGLILRVIDEALGFILPLISTRPRLSVSHLLWGIVWALFTLAAFKKSGMTVNDVKSTMSVKGIKDSMNLNEAKNFNFNDVKKSAGQAYSNTMNTVNQVKSEINQGNTTKAE